MKNSAIRCSVSRATRLYLKPTRRGARTHRHLVCEQHPSGGRSLPPVWWGEGLAGGGTWLRMTHFGVPRCEEPHLSTLLPYPGSLTRPRTPFGGALGVRELLGCSRNLTMLPAPPVWGRGRLAFKLAPCFPPPRRGGVEVAASTREGG